jgi:hydroxymethylpyrimidine pyrophosphatase-like HAD family hydrolase
MSHKKTLCFDFDGVIATYDGWKGFDVLGSPQNHVVETIREMKAKGYHITIFTTRLDTPTMRQWLKDNNVPYDSVNSNSHNPPNTSQKPIYHAIIDDRAVNYHGQSKEELIKEIEKVVSEV